jgi:hypothetical protein
MSFGFDKSERCYQIEKKDSRTERLELQLQGSNDNPIVNPAFVIKNWTASSASVLVDGKKAKDVRVGLNRHLNGDDLVVFLFLEKETTVNISIQPE